jgi:hypothetical protein
MPYLALASSIIDLTQIAETVQINKLGTAVKTDSHHFETVKQGITKLTEITPYHHIAGKALHLLRYLAKKCKACPCLNTFCKVGSCDLIGVFAGSLKWGSLHVVMPMADKHL